VLLQAGYRIDAESIERLTRFAVDAVWIRHPGFDYLDRMLPDDIPQRRAQLYTCVKQSFAGLASRTAGSFNLAEYRAVVGEMILSLVANKHSAVWALRLMDAEDELFAHSANVAYLALVIGMRLKEYVINQRRYVNHADGADLTNLGIGAMLHDLGKLGMDRQWWTVHSIDEEADSDEYRGHAERGYRAVRGHVEATAAQVLLHHHQRYDGAGFPKVRSGTKERSARPMKGTNIHVFSRIVAVANVLDALIGAANKRNLPLVRSLAALRRLAAAGNFDPIVVDAALRSVPPFPLGAMVALSDGRQAVVTGLNESNPCRPKVQLLVPADADGAEGSACVDLARAGSPTIARIQERAVDASCFYRLAPKPPQFAVLVPADEVGACE